MFQRGFAEHDQTKVKLDGLSYGGLQEVVNFSNGQELHQDFDKLFPDVLEVANFVQHDGVLKQCERIISSSLTVDNVVDVLELAQQLSLDSLFSKAFSFASWNFDRFTESPASLRISLPLLKRLVSSLHLNVKEESVITEFISKWISIDEESRDKHFSSIMKGIKVIDEDSKEKVVRKPPQFPCCIGRYKKSPFIFLYDPEESKLDPFLSLNGKATSNSGVTACGFQVNSTGIDLYVFGGEFSLGRGNWNTTVWKYDTLTEEWSKIMSLDDHPRRHMNLAVDCKTQSMYVLGGFGRHRVILNQVDRFSQDQIQLEACSDLPQPMFSVACFCDKGRLYVLKNQFNALVYDPNEDKWSKAFQHVSFPSGVEFNFAIAFNDFIYVTVRHTRKLYRFPLTVAKDSVEITCVGEFQQETQNLCLVDNVIYNFSSDQFAYYSTIETYNIPEDCFDLVFKTEDEELDFSPYYSFGCFPLVKFPFQKTS